MVGLPWRTKPALPTNSGPVKDFVRQCPKCHHDGFCHRDMRWSGPILIISCDWMDCNCSVEYVAVSDG